jgi:hypothetical protein
MARTYQKDVKDELRFEDRDRAAASMVIELHASVTSWLP